MTPPAFHPAAIRYDPEWEKFYDRLESDASTGRKPQQGYWKRFQAALVRLQNDALWGEVIPKGDIPSYFRERYGATNLYCIDLAGDMRCFYTVDAQDIVFLDLMDHDAYDRLFGLS